MPEFPPETPVSSEIPRGTALNIASGTRSSTPNFGHTNRCTIAVIVYFALLLDNVLLTVIVPILPGYLASIDNKTHYASLDTVGGFNAASSQSGSAMLPQNIAYRNLDGSPNLQAVLTKHPIPAGKSMVNFTLPVTTIDEKSAYAATTAAQRQIKHLVSSGNGTTIKNITAGNNNTVNNLSNGRRDEGKNGRNTMDTLSSENGSIGILLAMKALVQLIFNPIVGNLSSKRFGYRVPIVAGTFFLLVSSLVFAIGEAYFTLLLARAIQGVGSACIGVCGMSLVAQSYPEEGRRSKVMGIILGSIALGVLLGYPFGGILYDLIGKSAPFIILSAIIFLNLAMQLVTMDLSVQPELIAEVGQQKQPKWQPIIQNKMIMAIVIALWLSTSTMAILEPCLPIWLLQYIKPTNWQLGTVFIPDSVGYFVGTNFFGTVAYKYGQVKVSCISLLLVGISSILIPSATTVAQLLLPHFGLGLGIGIIDAALVPLLATFVDSAMPQEEQLDADNAANTNSMSSYGTVYAIQQTSVSLAYGLAPLIGGELAQAFGFAWIMRIVGFFNMLYGPVLVCLYQKYDPKTMREKQNEMLLTNTGRGSQYKQLYNSIDAE